ncbi:hypothetical protein FQN54_000794 [Arachnomyces sp. PD_36]|nr:hypothetical protein FQN54_000794 [Arachnomyces sp. PD_36]
MFGNKGGLDMMQANAQTQDENTSLGERVKRLEKKAKGFDEQLKRHEETIKTLKYRSEEDIKFQEGYRTLRHRFLETFKRHRELGENKLLIHQGNTVAHHGDAVADALLYTHGSNQRDDTYLMTVIYGFMPDIILLLSNKMAAAPPLQLGQPGVTKSNYPELQILQILQVFSYLPLSIMSTNINHYKADKHMYKHGLNTNTHMAFLAEIGIPKLREKQRSIPRPVTAPVLRGLYVEVSCYRTTIDV